MMENDGDDLLEEINFKKDFELNNLKESKTMDNKKYTTIKEYLEKFLYPDLKQSLNELIDHIRTTTLEEELTKEFRLKIYETNKEYNETQKELLKLERGSDYSEADYDHYMKNEVYNDKSDEEEKEIEPDFEDLNDEELANLRDQLENEEVGKKFNPIAFLAASLKKIIDEKKKMDFADEKNDKNDSEL